MRLLGITDLHGNHRALERIVAEAGPTTVVNCGYAAKGHYALVNVDHEVTVELCRA